MFTDIHESMQASIHQLDSFLDGFTFGTLIIENNRVTLATKAAEIHLNDRYLIEIQNGNEYMPITVQQALNAYDSMKNFPLFAGMTARVKKA
jgi:hypothetical protein